MKYELLIFDWDGTLMDSAGHIVASLQAAARAMALPVPDQVAASFVIGLGLREALQHLFPMLPVEAHPTLADHYRDHYLGRDHMIPLFAGVGTLLRKLHARGHTLAVATGKSRKGLERAMEYADFADLFSAIRTADQTFSKPHPAMIEELLEELDVAPGRTLMIGDTTHDLQMAQNAGVHSVGVSYGAHATALLESCAPQVVCHSVAELDTWLTQHA